MVYLESFIPLIGHAAPVLALLLQTGHLVLQGSHLNTEHLHITFTLYQQETELLTMTLLWRLERVEVGERKKERGRERGGGGEREWRRAEEIGKQAYMYNSIHACICANMYIHIEFHQS